MEVSKASTESTMMKQSESETIKQFCISPKTNNEKATISTNDSKFQRVKSLLGNLGEMDW